LRKSACIALSTPPDMAAYRRGSMRGRMRAKRWILKAGLPVDTLAGTARVTLYGNSHALVEGQHGVVEMGESCIRLRTADDILCIIGQGLQLHELSLDAAMIHGGRIETLTYGRHARESDR